MNSYKILKRQVFSSDEHSIIPIRFEDRYNIMKWRNEQVYHLRQDKPLTEEDQNNYFNTVISSIFDQDQPNQILLSYLNNEGNCIGYGGLVHINWADKNAEISFLMDTELEKYYFEKHWSIFLELVQQLAFEELNLHKLYVYAFDLRPHLYDVLVKCGYFKDATLKEHYLYSGKFIDVVIHSKLKDDTVRGIG